VVRPTGTQHRPQQLRCDDRGTALGSLDCGLQHVLRERVHAQVADCARLDRPDDRVLVAVRRAGDNASAAAIHARCHELAPPGDRRVEDHDVGVAQLRVLACVLHAVGLGDGLDAFQQLERRHKPPSVDRM
jgi:hypothetical protein